MSIILHEGDLPIEYTHNIHSVSIDTETTGLNILRDRLCYVQLCFDDSSICHIIKVTKQLPNNLIQLLLSPTILKLFHYARYDLSIMMRQWNLMNLKHGIQNIYCTKIASKLIRTYTDYHGLKELCRSLLEVHLDKSSQRSDWGAAQITAAQQQYAADDVLYLHRLMNRLNSMLEREGRFDIAKECFKAVISIARLDAIGFNAEIFAH